MVTDITMESIQRHFRRMGAVVHLKERGGRPGGGRDARVQIDLEGVPGRRHYVISFLDGVEDVRVADVRPEERHLLLMARMPDGQVHRYLCGHDERDWFVAAVYKGSSVEEAREALKPAPVLARQERATVKRKHRGRRRTRAYIRQGEWFFLPRPDFEPSDRTVLRNEPIRRSRGTPHVCEYLVRGGGERVYVANGYPNVLNEERYRDLLRRRPELTRLPWSVRMRDAQVYVKGRISHPDHRTVILRCWHEVLQNTEYLAPHVEQMVFLD